MRSEEIQMTSSLTQSTSARGHQGQSATLEAHSLANIIKNSVFVSEHTAEQVASSSAELNDSGIVLSNLGRF